MVTRINLYYQNSKLLYDCTKILHTYKNYCTSCATYWNHALVIIYVLYVQYRMLYRVLTNSQNISCYVWSFATPNLTEFTLAASSVTSFTSPSFFFGTTTIGPWCSSTIGGDSGVTFFRNVSFTTGGTCLVCGNDVLVAVVPVAMGCLGDLLFVIARWGLTDLRGEREVVALLVLFGGVEVMALRVGGRMLGTLPPEVSSYRSW